MAIKTVNALSHYTDWTIGHVHAGALGWVAMISIGSLYHLIPKVFGRPQMHSIGLINAHFWLATIGTVLYIASMWVNGITQGLMWRAAGAFMTTGGVARRLIDFANACVGHIRGGLAIAAVLACMLFAALSGSSPATVAAVGSIAIAGMVRSGYPQAFGAGIVCNAGTLGILIPPSIVMVVYAAATETGAFMTTGGVARRLIDFANACVGHIRGGLAIAAVLACMLFAALSGSSPATVAAVGSIAVAGMVRSGYPRAFGAGIICNAGTLGILIPPSIVMVVYAAATETFYPAVLEFEGMDVVVLAIALRIPRDQRLAAPVALDPEVVRILGLEDPHVVPLPVGEAALEPLGEPPEALMAPENQGFAAFRGPVAGAAVLDEQAVPLPRQRYHRSSGR